MFTFKLQMSRTLIDLLGGQASSPEHLQGTSTDLKEKELLVADLQARQLLLAVHLQGFPPSNARLGCRSPSVAPFLMPTSTPASSWPDSLSIQLPARTGKLT